MPLFNVRYSESYSGTFVVEADTPEQAEAIFQDKMANDCDFGDYISECIEIRDSLTDVDRDPLKPADLTFADNEPITSNWGE